jgi:hypothetical protein
VRFASDASRYLGFVSGLNGISLGYSELGGKVTNPFNEDPSGPYGISQQNYQNLVRGQSDATALHPPVWLTNNFGYGSGPIARRSDRRWRRSQMDIIPPRHRPDESDATRRSAERLVAARYRQQPADAALAVSAADLQYALRAANRAERRPALIRRRASKEETPMADDDRDFIERAESVTGKLYGKPATIDQIADHFALYGLKKRTAALENFDAELRGEIGSDSHSLRRHAQLMVLRRKMSGLHEALRKAKR